MILAVIESISDKLFLPSTGYEQDREIELANSEHVVELAVNTTTAAAIDMNNGKKPSFDSVREGVGSTFDRYYLGLRAKKANFVKKTDKSLKNDAKGFHSKRASQKNITIFQR